MLALRYGKNSRLCLEPDGESSLTLCPAPRGEPLVRVDEAVRQALIAPLEFPPLAQAATPGDKVVLALDRGVPQAAAIVSEVVQALAGAGVDPREIVLLHTQAGAGAGDPLAGLPLAFRHSVTCRVHDPANRDALSYLAAAADARPIYINRALHDADLVIPIGVLRLPASLGYYGASSVLFPAFSDAASLERYHSAQAAEPLQQARLCRRADEVGWLLGSQFTIQVVPAAAGGILHVVAGDPAAVNRAGAPLCEAAWTFSVPAPASLVVTTIEGDAAQQSWENVARALAAAARALDDDGAVVVCSELAEPPGPGLQCLAGADDLKGAMHQIARRRPHDVLAAGQLARSLERSKIYLVSQLDDAAVEELGILPLESQGVARLVHRYRSCLVLTNAHYAQAHTAAETAAQPAVHGKSR
jgi:nickel-dependent lactate racemase